MSWDISIQDLPHGITSVQDIPDDFEPRPLGDRSEIIARIAEFAPSADFSDASWGELVTPEFVIEFNMGRGELVDGMMLHVRGGAKPQRSLLSCSSTCTSERSTARPATSLIWQLRHRVLGAGRSSGTRSPRHPAAKRPPPSASDAGFAGRSCAAVEVWHAAQFR